MSQRHQYIGIENLGLNDSQKQTLLQALKGLGKADDDPQPARRIQFDRVRNDDQALIFEAVFEDNDWTIAAIKARLAAIFGVAVGTISHGVSTPTYGTVVTFTYSSIQRLRMLAFGGPGASWQQSRDATNAYLIDNAASWENLV